MAGTGVSVFSISTTVLSSLRKAAPTCMSANFIIHFRWLQIRNSFFVEAEFFARPDDPVERDLLFHFV